MRTLGLGLGLGLASAVLLLLFFAGMPRKQTHASGSEQQVRAVLLHLPKTAGATANFYFEHCASVSTQPHNGTAHRMTPALAVKKYASDIDVIVGLRHPADRIVSMLLWRSGYGHPGEDFAASLPPLDEAAVRKYDGTMAKYTDNATSGGSIVPICDPGVDLPRLAAVYGCSDGRDVLSVHQSHNKEGFLNDTMRRRIAGWLPRDLAVWDRYCPSTAPW